MNGVLRAEALGVELRGRTVFANLSFQLSKRETLVVLGPNGSGKTVLLRTLLGLIPHTGTVAWSPGVTFGYVPQRVPLNRAWPVTVRDFFNFRPRHTHSIEAMLASVGIADSTFPDKPLGILSSGEFQRTLIAWALAKDPTVLLFDEPTAGIDIGGAETIYDLVSRIQRERSLAIILVTHDLAVVFRQATHVLCLGHAHHCYGKPREVLHPDTLRNMYGTAVSFFQHEHE